MSEQDLAESVELAMHDYWFHPRVSWDEWRNAGEYIAARLQGRVGPPLERKVVRVVNEERTPEEIFSAARGLSPRVSLGVGEWEQVVGLLQPTHSILARRILREIERNVEQRLARLARA